MFSVEDLYIVENKKIKNIAKKDHAVDWIGGSCVYKILIGDQVVHVGRSDTCKKHGGAEKNKKSHCTIVRLGKTQFWNYNHKTLESNKKQIQTRYTKYQS